ADWSSDVRQSGFPKPPGGPLLVPGERAVRFWGWQHRTVNPALTIKWANIAGERGKGPPRLSTRAPVMVPPSGLTTSYSLVLQKARAEQDVDMSDIPAAPTGTISSIKLPGLGDISAFFKRGDIALAIGVLTILVVLILPLPPLLLDFSLAISIIFSVL